MSLARIAQKTGVSVSTVSRVLNGTARISEDVSTRVMAAAREIGYLDDRIRRAMQPAMRTLAVAVPSELLEPLDSDFVSLTIFDGLRRAAAARDIRIEPIISQGRRLDPDIIIPQLQSSQADAVVIFFDENPRILSAAAALKRPVVLLAGQDPTMQVPSVGIGNRNGGWLGTDYLLRLGHRKIALLTWPGRHTIRQREDGYREAIETMGEDPRLFKSRKFEPRPAEEEIVALLSQGGLADATALFCLADSIALSAIRACARVGVRVPDDLSILGFDDVAAGEIISPALTTIHAPLQQIGPAALDELEYQLRHIGQTLPVRRIELACSIVGRSSCRKLT